MKQISTILLLFLCSYTRAQVNLVLNPSFEDHTACPDNTGGDVYKATGWDTCRQSADYFNTCATETYFQVPKSYLGYQQPSIGNAYCGLYTYDPGSFYRECIISNLISPLIVGQKYYLSFKTNRADSNLVVGYSTNKLGARFSTIKQSNVPINNWAHYYSNTVITDTAIWTQLFGSFIADSAYQFIMLGNFFDDTNTTFINDGSGSIGYYFIDEVCVSTDSTFTQNYITEVPEINKESIPEIYPNPADQFIQLKSIKLGESKVFDLLGHMVTVKTSNGQINCSEWSNGLYLLETKTKVYKIIINH